MALNIITEAVDRCDIWLGYLYHCRRRTL